MKNNILESAKELKELGISVKINSCERTIEYSKKKSNKIGSKLQSSIKSVPFLIISSLASEKIIKTAELLSSTQGIAPTDYALHIFNKTYSK